MTIRIKLNFATSALYAFMPSTEERDDAIKESFFKLLYKTFEERPNGITTGTKYASSILDVGSFR